MAETKRVIYYDQLDNNRPSSGDVIFVDNPNTGTHKMDLKSFVDMINNGFDSSIKSSGVSVSADNYSSIITNVNDQPVNSIYTYGAGLQSHISNLPSNKAMTIVNLAQKSTGGLGQVMLAIERNGSGDYLYFRTIGGSPAVWSSWVKVANSADVESVREALDSQINDLKADFIPLRSGLMYVDGIFTRNSLYHGELANNYNYRIATRDIHAYSQDVTFNVNSGFMYLFNFFDDTNTFTEASAWQRGEYTVSANTKWRMMIARTTEDKTEVADISFFKSQVTTTTYFLDDIASLYAKNTEQDSEILNNSKKFDSAFNIGTQFINTTEFQADKYWYNSSGNINLVSTSSTGSGYYAYPELELKAGTYYLNYIGTNFCFIKGKTSGTVSTLSSVANNGRMILTEDSALYYTVRTSETQTIDTVMIADAYLPHNYVYGIYKVFAKFPSLSDLNLLNGNNNIIVVGHDADYQTISEACAAAVDGDIIFVLPGVYTEQISIWGKKLHIIGFDKKMCTILDHSADYDTPPLEMNIGTLANFTIIEDGSDPTPDLPVGKDHLAYCIHNDNYLNTDGETLEIVNCDMVNDVHACIGFGMYANYTVKIRDCTMRSNAVKDSTYKRGALYFHANSGNNIVGQKFIVENCIVSCADSLAVYAGVPGNGTGDFTVRFSGNQMWSDINGTSNDAVSISESNTFILDGGSTGNSIAKLNNVTPRQGSKNVVTVAAASSAVINNKRNRIVKGGVFEFCAVSEDKTSYDTGIIKWDDDGVLVIEQKNLLCNVSFSASNGEVRVWNRDTTNQHNYTVNIKPF